MPDIKKAIDLSNLPESYRKRTEQLQGQMINVSGIAGDSLLEPIPEFLKLPSEVVYSGKNNSWIVLGRDRNGSPTSGYGGEGHTQCGSIDFVVGRMSYDPKVEDENGNKIFVNPDFYGDAGRLYISQKANVDKYFGLAEGKTGSPYPRSAVALKADLVRIMGREGIKLVTNVDSKNSQGGDILSVKGIDLIAGNDDKDLQPMVKGDNTEILLKKLIKHIQDLNAIVDYFVNSQMKLNSIVTNHTHISPFFGVLTSPSIALQTAGKLNAIEIVSTTKPNIIANKINLTNVGQTYLEPYGAKYINSYYNSVN